MNNIHLSLQAEGSFLREVIVWLHFISRSLRGLLRPKPMLFHVNFHAGR